MHDDQILGFFFFHCQYMHIKRVIERDIYYFTCLVTVCAIFSFLVQSFFLQVCLKIVFCLLKQVMWSFSLYLEAVAILPQLVLLQRTRNIDNLTGQYVFLLGWHSDSETSRSFPDILSQRVYLVFYNFLLEFFNIVLFVL